MITKDFSNSELLRYQDDPDVQKEIIQRFLSFISFCEENDIFDEELKDCLYSIKHPVTNETEQELERIRDDNQELEDENLELKKKLKNLREKIKYFSEDLEELTWELGRDV